MADESISVNYVPIRVSDLPVANLGDLNTTKILVARDASNDLGYTTAKVPYDNISASLYEDLFKKLSADLGISVYTDVTTLYEDNLIPTYAFGANPIQFIFNGLRGVQSCYVDFQSTQNITGKKIFVGSAGIPRISADLSEIDEVSGNVATVGWVKEQSFNYSPFVFSNDTKIQMISSWNNPSKTSSGTKKILNGKSNFVYQAKSDCILLMRVISKQNSAGMSVRIGDSDPLTQGGQLVISLPDNDKEAWWIQTIQLPVMKGTYVKLCASDTLWWIIDIKEAVRDFSTQE